MRKNCLPDNFRPETALRCLQLINAAYGRYTKFKTTDAQSIDLPEGYNFIEELWAKPEGLFSQMEPFGFMVKHPETNTIYVVFRGTESLDDWFSDLSVEQVTYEIEYGCLGKIHAGFYNLYKQFPTRYREPNLLGRNIEHGETIVVTGHSLGAALATIAEHDCPSICTTSYTFASPRVGDREFVEGLLYKDDITKRFRIFNTEDIVPAGPLPVIDELVYSHTGVPIAFTDNQGDIVKNHSSEEGGGTYWNFVKSLIG